MQNIEKKKTITINKVDIFFRSRLVDVETPDKRKCETSQDAFERGVCRRVVT